MNPRISDQNGQRPPKRNKERAHVEDEAEQPHRFLLGWRKKSDIKYPRKRTNSTMIYDLYAPRFWEVLDLFPPPHILRRFKQQDRSRLAGSDFDYIPDVF